MVRKIATNNLERNRINFDFKNHLAISCLIIVSIFSIIIFSSEMALTFALGRAVYGGGNVFLHSLVLIARSRGQRDWRNHARGIGSRDRRAFRRAVLGWHHTLTHVPFRSY